MRTTVFGMAVILATAGVLFTCGQSKAAETRPAAGSKAPAFMLKSFDGKEISLSDYAGKIVVLEWFNYECPFVRYHYEKAGTMVELANRYRDKNVVWLAINSTSHATPDQNKEFADRHKLPYPILDDRLGAVGRAYGAKSTPHMYIIDTNGVIAYSGAIDNSPLGREKEGVINYVDRALAELTAGKPVSAAATEPYGCSVKYGKAPAFTLKSFDGREISLSDYAGKIVVLEWFNDECPFVRYHYEKAGTMVELANRYRDKNVVWLAINSTSHATPDQNKEFADRHKLPYPILDDRSGVVGRAYGARTTPHIYIIDAKGSIVYAGAIDDSPLGRKQEGATNYVDAALAELAGGKTISTPTTRPYGCSVKYGR
ncbi:MAG TPA: thioredoxin family protein [Sedimentisphaerales bacterium]|nr:thioredoxin family protein [Sedimentisphaerales bacterium]